jgi:hypothetical protein
MTLLFFGWLPLLHFVRSALAIENVSRFSGAFALALSWLFAAAYVRAGLFAPNDFLFWCSDRLFLIFIHVLFPWFVGGGRDYCKFARPRIRCEYDGYPSIDFARGLAAPLSPRAITSASASLAKPPRMNLWYPGRANSIASHSLCSQTAFIPSCFGIVIR